MERLIPAPSLTVSSCLHYSRDVVEVLHCSFTTFCLPSTPSSFAAPLPLVTGGDSRRCRYSYISIYPFLMASCFPELEPSYSGSVGPVMLSGLVATLCNLRARVCDLGSALTAIPGGRAMSISSGPQMTKKKVLVWDGLCWANICKDLLKTTFHNCTKRADGINAKQLYEFSCCFGAQGFPAAEEFS